MLVKEIFVSLISSGILKLTKSNKYLKLRILELLNGSKDLRISFSTLLKVIKGDQYLLIQSNTRPELFGPIGGVNKYYVEESKKFLNNVCFRPQVVEQEMQNDLRGFIPFRNIVKIVAWYTLREESESMEDCIRRELHEELSKLNIGPIVVPRDIHFRLIREIWEGPRNMPGEKYKQFRIFQICEIRQPSELVNKFVDRILNEVSSHKDLLLASANEIIRGRARNGDFIGAHSEYLFNSHLHRSDAPAFVSS